MEPLFRLLATRKNPWSSHWAHRGRRGEGRRRCVKVTCGRVRSGSTPLSCGSPCHGRGSWKKAFGGTQDTQTRRGPTWSLPTPRPDGHRQRTSATPPHPPSATPGSRRQPFIRSGGGAGGPQTIGGGTNRSRRRRRRQRAPIPFTSPAVSSSQRGGGGVTCCRKYQHETKAFLENDGQRNHYNGVAEPLSF